MDNEGQIRRFQPLVISGGNITQKVSGTALKLLGANADILSLGDATHEGGDLKIYRNATGDLQLSLDADAASNAIALSVYGGGVAQNYLTVGQAALYTAHPFYVHGNAVIAGTLYIDSLKMEAENAFISGYTNQTVLPIDIAVNTPNVTDHSINVRIDSNDIIVAQATGDGSGGITNKAIGLYGATPTTQAAHIADPAENAAANNAAIDAILVALRNIGILASS